MSDMVPAADHGDDANEPATPIPAEAAGQTEATEPAENTEGGAAEGQTLTPRGENVPPAAPAPAPSGGPPAVRDDEGADDNGFLSLGLRIMWVVSQAARLTSSMHLLRRRMDSNATKARVLAEFCAAADVEDEFTAMILEASEAFSRVANASGELADAADSMEFKGRSFKDAHDSEYRGVYEAVKASGRRQPKPGFNRNK